MPDTNPVSVPSSPAPSSFKRRFITPRSIIVGAALLFLLGMAVVFAGPMLRKYILPSGDAHELFQNMFNRVLEINSASYDGTVTFGIEPRTPNSRPFSFVAAEAADQKAKLDRDVNRFRDLEEISRKLVDPNALFNAFMGGQGNPVSFPATIDQLGVNIKDPLTETPYRYVRAPDGKSATLAITFETGEAIDTIAHRNQSAFSPMPMQEEGPTINGQTVTFHWPAYSYFYSFNGKPSQPFFAELFGNESDFLVGFPENLNGTIKAHGVTAKTSTEPTDAHFAVQANVHFSSFTFDASGDLIKKGDVSYARLNMTPFFFIDFSRLKDTWVKIMPEDIPWGSIPFRGLVSVPGDDALSEQKGPKLLEHLQLLLKVAKADRAFAENGAPASESVEGAAAYRYAVKLNKDQIVPFYKHLTEQAEAQFGSNALIRQNAGTLSYLESRSFAELFEYLKNQMEFTVWVDHASGYPVRFRYVLRYVPPDSVKQLAEKQFVASFDIKLTDINKPAPVAAPESFISFAEAEDLLSGLTKEEGLFSRQAKNISLIQSAIRQYFVIARQYPTKLEDLLITTKGLQEKYPMRSPASSSIPLGFGSVSGFGLSSLAFSNPEGKLLPAIPHDVYTGMPYEYRLQGTDGYRLRYTMQTPPFSEKINSMIGQQIDRYVDGVNTATAATDSLEARNQQRDSDRDGLSDRVERYYGTDPNKRDTDGDGYTDNDEITRGYNPKGPGRLERNETFPFFGL